VHRLPGCCKLDPPLSWAMQAYSGKSVALDTTHRYAPCLPLLIAYADPTLARLPSQQCRITYYLPRQDWITSAGIIAANGGLAATQWRHGRHVISKWTGTAEEKYRNSVEMMPVISGNVHSTTQIHSMHCGRSELFFCIESNATCFLSSRLKR
jgi:hypothetical protein